MKNISDIASKWIFQTSLCFTLTVTAFALAGFALRPDANALFCSQLLYMLAFSALIGLTFSICSLFKGNAVIRRTFQFVLSYASFALTFFLGGAGKGYLDSQSSNKVFTVVCMSFIFIGVYFVIAALVCGFDAAKSAFWRRGEKYEKQFENIEK